MSKKIAQLTKVIYHLNNKNEDHEVDLQELAEQYETEIEQILRDTADKINHFKAQLDAANDQARIMEITKVSGLPQRGRPPGLQPPPAGFEGVSCIDAILCRAACFGCSGTPPQPPPHCLAPRHAPAATGG